MIHHEPFNDMLPEIDGFFIRGRYNHAILSVDHAAHLDALDWTFYELDRTETAGPHRAQTLMIAEAGNHDAQALGCYDHLRPLGDLDF
jgi:hypothetical protein